MNKKRVLFFAEGATLAHVARPYLLAESLDSALWEIVFARPSAFFWLTCGAKFTTVDLSALSSAAIASRLGRGLPIYSFKNLKQYVENDLFLFEKWRPDIVVGDFRLSLSVSARLRKIPYIAIADAYWSPCYSHAPSFPVFGWASRVPLQMATYIFNHLSPTALKMHAHPIEKLRKYFGFSSLGHQLGHCYTDSDKCLFANFHELFPEIKVTRESDFIGPLAWSPPDDANLFIPQNSSPLVYITMGSSGSIGVLATIISLLKDMGCRAMIATAGKEVKALESTETIRIHDYLPGHQLCKQADVVICNGGSPMTNQALVHGVPVIGITSNMDQFFNMDSVSRYGAGIGLRADGVNKSRLNNLLKNILQDNSSFQKQAKILANLNAEKQESAGQRLEKSLLDFLK